MGLKDSQAVQRFIDTSGWFHPMSNNLYDEEIRAIYKSAGIIGITMKERALGWNAYNYKKNDSTKDLLKKFLVSKYGKEFLENKPLINELEKTEPFVRNLFYIVEHSGYADKTDLQEQLTSWLHIGIGSDFYGVMNPLDICPTAAHIPYFYQFLCDHLILYADYLGKKRLLMNQTPQFLLRKVFYMNGEIFIKKYF